MSAPPPQDGADPAGNLDQLAEVARDPSVERAVVSVRDLLAMDVAYVTHFEGDRQIFHTLRGDGESFGIAEGGDIELDQTYCQQVLAGRMESLTPDLAADPIGGEMPITDANGVGAFVSVPLELSDGSLFGTLCAADHSPRPDLGSRELQFLRVFARMISDRLEHDANVDRERLLELQAAAVEALIAAVSARDTYTGDHSREVVEHSVAVAERLGLADEEVAEVANVALLHDIGKLKIPDAILHKPGPLDGEEWKVMHLHPIFGEQLVSEIPELAHLAPAIRAEHERWDGGGYPDGLTGEQIPIASRIVFACDAYHAMTSDRSYRAALPVVEAVAELGAGAGTQFCPSSAATLLEVVGG
jgi:response regulator RpfG family c-di-GMP phosphodiesterase